MQKPRHWPARHTTQVSRQAEHARVPPVDLPGKRRVREGCAGTCFCSLIPPLFNNTVTEQYSRCSVTRHAVWTKIVPEDVERLSPPDPITLLFPASTGSETG